MAEQRFNIVFKGEIVTGANEAAVKANVAKLFKANDKVLARLFSGARIEIKKNVDRAGAMKYRALLKKAGALCYAVEIGESVSPASKKESGWTLAPVGALLIEAQQVIEAIPLPDI